MKRFALWLLAVWWLATPVSAVELTLAFTTDQHNWLSNQEVEPRRKARGLLHLAPHIQRLRAQDPDLLLLDAGDSFQGSPLARFANQQANPAAINPFFATLHRLGYDALAVGNHDLEENPAFEDSYLPHSQIPILAANAYRNGKNAFLPYVILQRKGLKIAVLGVTTPGAHLWLSKERLRGLEIKSLKAEVQAWVQEIRQRENPDLLILLGHAGLAAERDDRNAKLLGLPPPNEMLAVLEEVPGVDLALLGHDHRRIPYRTGEPLTYAGQTPVLAAGSEGSVLLAARLQVEGKRLQKMEVEVLLPVQDKAIGQAYLEQLPQAYLTSLEEFLPWALATTEKAALQACLGEAQAAALGPVDGYFFPLNRLGSLRSLKGKPLTRKVLWAWFPYQNRGVLLQTNARTLQRLQSEQQDPTAEYNRRMIGSLPRVQWPKSGWILDSNWFEKRYQIWISDYHFQGGGGLAGELLWSKGDAKRIQPQPLVEELFAWLKGRPVLPKACQGVLVTPSPKKQRPRRSKT